MAKQSETFQSVGYDPFAVNITAANTTDWVTLYTVPASDATIKGIGVTTTDTTTVNLRVAIDIGGTVYPCGCINIPVGAGTNGVARTVDLLNSIDLPQLPVDRNGKRVLPLKEGNIIKIAALATMTANKVLTALGFSEKF
ncbi:MAG: hypothetical protein WCO57_04695 [Verrucomicrobiota bacterium]